MLAGEEEAEREWLMEAEKLVESFRETRPLFLTSRVSCLHALFGQGSKRITRHSIRASVECSREARGGKQLRRAKRAWLIDCNSSLVEVRSF